MSNPSEQSLWALSRFPALFVGRIGALAPSIWIITIVAILLDLALIHFTGLQLVGVTPVYPLVLGLALLGPVIHHYTGYRQAALIAEACGVFICLILAGEILSYPATTSDFPLYDGYVLAADRELRFDWLSTMRALDRHPTTILWLRFVYHTIWVQGFVILIVLSCKLKIREIENFLFAFVGCYVVTILISIFFPVLGVLTQFPGVTFQNLHFEGGATEIPFVIALRNGSLDTIDVQNFQGVIVMPSFHAVMAVLWIYAAWRTGRFFWIILPLNVLMAFAALTEGGHYLCDVLAGTGLAVSMIAIVEYRSRIKAGRGFGNPRVNVISRLHCLAE